MHDTTTQDPTTDAAAPAAADPTSSLSFLLTFDADEDLRDDLAAVLGDNPDQRVQDDAAAARTATDRLLRALGRVQAESRQLTADRDDELRVVAMHFERKLGSVREREQRLARALEALAESLIPGDAKKKTLDLPFGCVKRKDTKATTQLADPDALAKHLAEVDPTKVTAEVKKKLPYDLAVMVFSEAEREQYGVKLVPAWAEVKKGLSPDGELPPGVERVAPATAFEVEAYTIR